MVHGSRFKRETLNRCGDLSIKHASLLSELRAPCDGTRNRAFRTPVPMSKVLFQSSGSEANDTAIKLVWYYFSALGKPEKRKIISRKRAYHGTSIASASLTGLPQLHLDFNLPLPGFLHLTCPHLYREGSPGETEEAFATRLAEELDALIGAEGPETVAAFFAEPAMGTGGVVIPPETYFEKI